MPNAARERFYVRLARQLPTLRWKLVKLACVADDEVRSGSHAPGAPDCADFATGTFIS